MQKRKRRLFAGASSLVLLGWLALIFYSAQAQSPTPPPAPDIASVSEEVNQHTHSVTISNSELDGLIAITGDNDTVTLQSSQAYDGDPKNGALHSHQIKMDKQQLQVLKQTGSIDIECEEAAGHKHIFRFYKPQPQQCTTITYPQPQTYFPGSCPYGGKCVYPMPYPTTCTVCPKPCVTCQYPYPYPTFCPTCPTPKPCATCKPLPPPGYTPTPLPSTSPGATGSPAPSPSVSASPSPSVSASPSPSVSVSASPNPSASPGVNGSPSPIVSVSASPGTASPSPSASASAGSTPSPSPTSTCSIPGTDCYCADPVNFGDPACATVCQTAGTPCYCASNPLDPSCPVGGGTTRSR